MRRRGNLRIFVLVVSMLVGFAWFLANRGAPLRTEGYFDVVYLGSVVHIENMSDTTLADVKVMLGPQRVLLAATGKLVPEPAGPGEPYGHRFEPAAGKPLSLMKGEVAEFQLNESQRHQPLTIAYRRGDVAGEEVYPGLKVP